MKKTLNMALVKFFRKVEIIIAMEMGGKIDPETAYQNVKQQLKILKKDRKESKKTSH